MTLDELKASLNASSAPADLPPALVAMWHDARGNWDAAHEIAQEVDSPDGAWVHAYLHRKEGDLSNAAYWYRRAARPVASGTLDDEWTEIVTTLLAPR